MENAAAADRPTSRLDNHSQQLSDSLQGLERAALQCDNMLRRLRGVIPDNKTADKQPTVGQVDPPIMQRLDILSERIQDISSRLNNQVDEMQEYV